MSRDTSPPSGYRLDNPARTGGGAGAAAPERQLPSNPSWLKVISTTLRLWLRRRVLHVPDAGRVGSARRGRLAVLLATAIVIIGGGIAAGIMLTAPSAAVTGHPASTQPSLTPGQLAARQAAQAAARANTAAAAAWIAAQVAPGTVIGCDPAACAAILQAGYPTSGQVVLQPGVRLPGPGALIVATGIIRGQYRAQLTASAPEAIAAFGSGAEAVQVRVAVPGGSQAYSQAASAAVTARSSAGQALLASRNMHASGKTRNSISSGRLDPRVTGALHQLAVHYSVYVVRLADTGPGFAGTLPYRMAEVAVVTTQAGRHRVSDLAGMEKLLRADPAGDRPQLSTARLADGKRVLRIWFPAPTPQ